MLRQRYDDGWTLRIDGLNDAGHYRADGMTNAWLIAGNGQARFSIVYAPQTTAFVLLAISFAAAMLFVGVALPPRRRADQLSNGK